MKHITYFIFLVLYLGCTKEVQKLDYFDNLIVRIDKKIESRSNFFTENDPYVVKLYDTKGLIYAKKGQYNKALSSFQKSLNIYLKIVGKNHPSTAEAFYNIAHVLSSQGNYKKSLHNYNISIDIYLNTTGKNSPKLPLAYGNIAALYLEMEEYTKTILFAKKSLKLMNSTNSDTLKLYNYLSDALQNKGQYTEALFFYNKALELIIEKKIGNDDDLIMIWNGMGAIYTKKGNYENALMNYNLALKASLAHYGEQYIFTATIYSNMATILNDQGNYDEALKFNNKALHIHKNLKGNQVKYIANIYNNMATALQGQGEYAEALKLSQKSLKEYHTILPENSQSIADQYNAISTYYSDMNNYKKAMLYRKKSITIYQKIFGDKNIHTIKAKSNLIVLKFDYAQYTGQTSKEFFKQLFYLSKKLLEDNLKLVGINNPTTANLYNLCGSLSVKIDQLNEAISFYKKALKSYSLTNIETHTHDVIILNDINKKNLKNFIAPTVDLYIKLGGTYNQQKNYTQALLFYNKALSFLKSIQSKNIDLEQRLYYQKAWTHYLNNDYNQAFKSIEKFFSFSILLENKNFEYLDNSQKFLAKDNYKLQILFQISDKYLNELKNTNINQYQQVIKVILNHWIKLKGTIFEDENLLAMLEGKTTNVKIKKKIQEYRNQKRFFSKTNKQLKKISELEIELNKESKKYKEFFGLKNITSQNISTHLKNNELYIDFIKTNENYYFFTLNKNNQINFIQINTEDSKTLELHIKNLKSNNQKMVQAIKNKTIKKEQAQLKKESHVILSKLYDILISKYLRTQLQTTKELIISPDGLLNFLPFEALYHNKKYLIEDYKISYTSSGREFVRQTKREPYKVGSRKMICFGNPDFNTSLPVSEIKGKLGSNNQQVEETWEQYKDFSVIGDEEIVTIKNLYKDALIYEDKEANVENLMKVSPSQILHFSTHGKFLNNQTTIKNPLLKAGIALSGANVKGDLSGIVTALKVSALDLSNTELVVLSACESGLGEVQNAEGVMGLPKAFLQAGAREVIMSLWSVSNQKTAMLMEKFYTNVQRNQDYNTALRNAKTDMINEEMHPYYWSAFIMHGIQN